MKPRARDLGIPFDGTPGPLNAITDVAGVWVGNATLVEGEGELIVGRGPVRTGVTAIRPRGADPQAVYAAYHSLNGCGEMTGTIWLEESGMLNGPLMLTNTFSIGAVHQATIDWVIKNCKIPFGLPIVTETYDGYLNDIHGFHVKAEHVNQALEIAQGGAVLEGNHGGGTGMVCYEFKGGIGTASRLVKDGNNTWCIGVLVQANHGSREQLTIAGVPLGKLLQDHKPEIPAAEVRSQNGSIIVIVATDLPLLPHQLKRLAHRVPLGLARTGAISEVSSGDIFLAFSTAPLENEDEQGFRQARIFNDWKLNPIFEAVVQACEESVVNALCAAETMQGINRHTVYALPQARVVDLLRQYHRLV